MIKKLLLFLLLSVGIARAGEQQPKLSMASALMLNLPPGTRAEPFCDGSQQRYRFVYACQNPSERNFFTVAHRTDMPAIRDGLIRVGTGGAGLAISLLVQKYFDTQLRKRLRNKKGVGALYFGKKAADLFQLFSQFLLFGGFAHSTYHQWHDTQWRRRFYTHDGVRKGESAAAVFAYDNFHKPVEEGGLDWKRLYDKNKKIGDVSSAVNVITWTSAAVLHAVLIAVELLRIKHEKKIIARFGTLPEPQVLTALNQKTGLNGKKKKAYQQYARYLHVEKALRWLIGITQAVGSAGLGVRARFLPLLPRHRHPDGLFEGNDDTQRYQVFGAGGTHEQFEPHNIYRWWAPLLSMPSCNYPPVLGENDGA